MQDVQTPLVHVFQQGLQGLASVGQSLVFLGVWHPLLHMEVFLALHGQKSHVVETLQGAHTGGANGNGRASVCNEPFYGCAVYGNVLRVHVVAANLLALDWLEGAGTNVQGNLLALYAMVVQFCQHLGGEVQTCRGGSHTALYLGVDGLVGGEVALLCLSVQVGRNGQFARGFEDFCPSMVSVPGEVYLVTGAVCLATGGREGDGFLANLYLLVQGTCLPLLQVAHKAIP